MKKFLIAAVSVVIFASCKNNLHSDYGIGSVINKDVLHPVFSKQNKAEDSLKSNTGNRFNFFLKEVIAKKFGF